MKILMVNKFLYPNGGSETYIFELGKQLQKIGHDVQFFGMEHRDRIVGNDVECYTSNMDFHNGKLQKIIYPFKIIYSFEARKKIRKVLKNFQPDVVHLNNINFQITPSIIDEIRRYEGKIKRKVQIIFTAHDYQWVCPNHMFKIPATGENCQRCLGGHFINCTKYKCIHKSRIKSMLGTIESYFYHTRRTYAKVDSIICPSQFLYEQFACNELLKKKLIVLPNFVKHEENMEFNKENYVLYFGRFAEEKGIVTLLEACKQLPEIPFVFAGNGSMETEVNALPNIKNVGFQNGEDLYKLISQAKFSIYPSEWYENCPFSVMESQIYGTPVIGARIGGIPELIKEGQTGELFESGNVVELKEKIERLWNDTEKCKQYSANCKNIHFDDVNEYCEKLLKVYSGSS